MTRIVWTLLAAGALLATACDAREPYCEFSILCVESCGGPAFRQCGPCPDGSILEETCADGG